MTVEQSYAFAVLAATLGLFIWGKWRYDVVAVLALLAVGIPGIVTAKDVFAGFGHPAVITVAAVLVISKTLQASGFVGHIGNVLAKAEVGPSLQVFLVASIVAALSGFMNNVGALALLLPIVLQMAKKSGRSPRSLLMPLSFGSLLGGLVTMIGTPPNIIVAAYRAEFSGTPFSMFDFTPVGLVIALAGILFITFAGWRLIPNRDAKSGGHTEMFRIDNYITEVLVPKDSALIGQTIEHMLDLGGEDGVAVVAQIRRGHRRLGPRPDQLLRGGDHLLLEGEPTEIEGLLANTKLKTVGTLPLNLEDLASESIGLVEAVITPQARLVGRTSRQALLGRHYGLNLLAIARHGQPIRDRLNRVRFRAGDVLLIQGDMEAMPDALARLGCLPLPHRNIAFDAKSGIVPLAIFAGAILSIAFRPVAGGSRLHRRGDGLRAVRRHHGTRRLRGHRLADRHPAWRPGPRRRRIADDRGHGASRGRHRLARHPYIAHMDPRPVDGRHDVPLGHHQQRGDRGIDGASSGGDGHAHRRQPGPVSDGHCHRQLLRLSHPDRPSVERSGHGAGRVSFRRLLADGPAAGNPDRPGLDPGPAFLLAALEPFTVIFNRERL